MTVETYQFEVQIRQNTNDVPTNDPNITNVEVINNTFEDVDLKRTDNIRVYVADDHDVALDVQIEHTHTRDDDFSDVHQEGTISLTSGNSQGTARLEGPLGKVRLVVLASQAASVPASGSLIGQVIAHG